jgi:hypothetical protein
MLVGNGTVAPLYIEAKKKFDSSLQLSPELGHIEYLPPKMNRRGERGVLACLEFQRSVGTFSPGDVLISDAERAFDTPLVLNYLESIGVTKLTFPKGLGHLMNPCDNSFHAEAKMRYYHMLAHESTFHLPFERKIDYIKHGYYGGSEAAIRHYFSHTGILSRDDPEHVMKSLLHDGMAPTPEWQDTHQKQLMTYNQWCAQK